MLLWNEETRRNKGKEGVPGVAITDLKKKKSAIMVMIILKLSKCETHQNKLV